jgi:allantoinase
MPMIDTALRARRAIRPDGETAATVSVTGGRIVDVAAGLIEVDAVRTVEIPDDCVLLPGLVDSHVHVNEPGRTEWEGFATATAAAAKGGVTTIVDMPLNSIPPTVDVDSLRAKQDAARGQCRIDVAFWGGAIPGNADELAALHEAGVVGFKCFLLPSGVDEFPPLDRDGLLTAMRRIAGFDGLLIAHAEDQAVIDSAPDAHGRHYADFLASRPAAAENTAIDGLISAAAETGCRTHIVHLSSAAALDSIAKAKADGVPLTVETCPHYLTLTDAVVPDGATQFKCCPPIRDAANADRLWQALSDGLIDCIVSDHSPCTAELKRFDTGDFGQAWGGIASVQLGLPVVWTAARARGVALSDLVRWMSAAPAALANLPAKGAIAVGKAADFAVFAPDETFVVDPAKLEHRNPITAYAGSTLSGVVRQTWLSGEPIDSERNGRLIARGSA